MIRTEHREKKWEFPFVCYSCSKQKENLPLVVQLHGAGERGNGEEDLKLVDVNGFSNCLEGKDFSCIIVMPQCPKDSFWAAQVESIVHFIGQLIEEFHVDPDKVSLTGLSMGGYGTWFTAMAKPELFSAIAPVCGGGMAWNAGVLTMPVWAFHGSCDETVSVTQTDEMVEALKNCGLDVTYNRIDGVGHNVWENAYTEDLLLWLTKHTKK